LSRIISGTLYVESYVQINPGEYTFTDAIYENQSDPTGSGSLAVTPGYVLFIPAVDPATAQPLPGVVTRYKVTSIQAADGLHLSATILWDDEGTQDDDPQNASYAMISEPTQYHQFGLPVAEEVYYNLQGGSYENAIVKDIRHITDKLGLSGIGGFTGIGATGLPGATGWQGVTGPAGAPQGETGAQGSQGYTGAQGLTGALGTTGAQGFTGLQGAGTTGLRGFTGSQGVTGSFGSVTCFDLKSITSPSLTHKAYVNQGDYSSFVNLSPTNFISTYGTQEYSSLQYHTEWFNDLTENNWAAVGTTGLQGNGLFLLYSYSIGGIDKNLISRIVASGWMQSHSFGAGSNNPVAVFEIWNNGSNSWVLIGQGSVNSPVDEKLSQAFLEAYEDLTDYVDSNNKINVRVRFSSAFIAGITYQVLTNYTVVCVDTRPVGFKGETGTQGHTGSQGETGAQGYTGLQGSEGTTGLANWITESVYPTGVVNIPLLLWNLVDDALFAFITGMDSWIQISSGSKIGSTGLQGATGVGGGGSGVTGIPSPGGTGLQGPTGPAGLRGATGLPGVTGLRGSTGAQGVTGLRGFTGAQGVSGLRGVTGISGVTGVPGIDGATGTQGVTGYFGLDGATGVQGVTGYFGADGVTGPQGVTGLYVASQANVIQLGVPTDGGYSGIFAFTPSTLTADAIDNINDLLMAIAPSPPGPLAGALVFAGTKYSAILPLGLNASQWYQGGKNAGDSISDYVVSNVYTMTSPNTSTAFKAGSTFGGDVGNIVNVVNNADDSTRAVTSGVGISGNIEITSLVTYNTIWRKANARINYTQATPGFIRHSMKYVYAGTQQTGDVVVWYDNTNPAPTFSAGAAVAQNTLSSARYLSGVRYYSTGDTFNFSAVIDNIANQCLRPTNPVSYLMPGVNNVDIAIAGTSISYNQSYSLSTTGTAINASSVYNIDARLTVTARKPSGTSNASTSASVNRLVNTVSATNSTNGNITMYDENYRFPLTTNFALIPGSITGNWVSSAALTNGNAILYNATWNYPLINYTIGYVPAQGVGTDYSTFSGDQVVVWGQNIGLAHSGMSIVFTGISYTDISEVGAGNLNLEVRLPSVTGWFDAGRAFGDGAGCRLGSSSGSTLNMSFGVFSSSDSNGIVFIRVTLRNSSAAKASAMVVSGT
jgi:hypothetical protein